jgi:hypothetical protein
MEGMLAQKMDGWQFQLMIASIASGPLENNCAETSLINYITIQS